MIAEQLKKAVLQAAVQGELTQQLPEDGDAHDLIEEIKAEKARLIQEGKIKQEKSLPAITEDEIPFDIPENWVWVRLGDISLFENGDRSSAYPKSHEYVEMGIPFFGAADMVDGRLTYDSVRFISKEKFYSLRSGKLKDQDFVCLLRGSIGKTARFEKTEKHKTGFINAQMVIIRLLNLDFISYIESIFGSPNFSKFITDVHTGTAVKQLPAETLRKYIVPLPPKAEQQRIVCQLNEILPFIDELETDETKLEEIQNSFPGKLKSSILQAAIQGKLTEQLPSDGDARELLAEIQAEKLCLIQEGKIKKEKPLPAITEDEIPFDIPENWAWCRLGEVCNVIMGQSPNSSTVGDRIGIEFHQGKINFTDKKISDSGRRCSNPKKIAAANSVLLCVRAPVGIVNITDREICIGRGLASIHGFGIISTDFLFYYLSAITKYFTDSATGSTFKAINQKIVKGTALALPPIEEQRRIVARINELLPLIDSLE